MICLETHHVCAEMHTVKTVKKKIRKACRRLYIRKPRVVKEHLSPVFYDFHIQAIKNRIIRSAVMSTLSSRPPVEPNEANEALL
jgi:hypothetical protein